MNLKSRYDLISNTSKAKSQIILIRLMKDRRGVCLIAAGSDKFLRYIFLVDPFPCINVGPDMKKNQSKGDFGLMF